MLCEATTVRRPWLEREVESAMESAAIIALLGPPGAGKTTFSRQLAESWDACAYFARSGSADTALAADAKVMFVALGLGLRQRFGVEIFGPPQLELKAEASAGTLVAGAELTGASVGAVSLSPFRRIVIDARIQVERADGRASAVFIGEIYDMVARMSVAELAVEALLSPLERLLKLHPKQTVRLVIDAVENADIASALPLPSELPANTRLLVTSRVPEVIDRLAADDESKVKRIQLGDGDAVLLAEDDICNYLTNRLNSLDALEALKSSAAGLRPLDEVARDLAQSSEGNFLHARHLVEAIRAGATKGDFSLLLSPASAPQGLDGIYRYFLTTLREGVGVRDWLELYAPVLGVLAVARSPLTSRQLADISGVPETAVAALLGEIPSLVVSAMALETLAVQFYHSSFASFLLDQDRTRNPYPLSPADTYHRKIVAHYDSPGLDWNESKDSYALLHLPAHAQLGGNFDDAVRLMRGAFGRRQAALLGPTKTWTDCIVTARSAALTGDHSAFLLLAEQAARFEGVIQRQWQDGSFILSLVSAPPDDVLHRVPWLSGHVLPWSAFLAAERLLDADSELQARDVLRKMVTKVWGDYTPPRHGFNQLEGTSFDFIPEDSVIEFLAKVAAFDPALARDLVERLFEDEPVLPNARTAWREVLALVLCDRMIGMDTAKYVALAQATLELLRKEGYVLGWVGITRALFRILWRCAPHALVDPLWIANAQMTAVLARMSAASTIVGSGGGAALYGGLADVLSDSVALWESVLAVAPDAQITQVLKDSWGQIVEQIPPTPKFEAHVEGSSRVEWFGKLAFALHRVKSSKATAYAAAAMECALHDVRWKRWAGSIGAGLSWLAGLSETTISTPARELMRQFGFAEVTLSELDRAGEVAHPSAASVASVAEVLAKVAKEHSPYTRGRLALELWIREGDDIRTRLTAALAEAGSRLEKKAPDRAQFADILAAALANIVASSGAPFSEAAIRELDATMSAEGRTHYELELDSGDVLQARWVRLNSRGQFAELDEAVTKTFDQASAERDVNLMLACCIIILPSNPDRASVLYETLQAKLSHVNDRGHASSWLVATLLVHHSERMKDLGYKWAAQLPKPAGRGIAGYELVVCDAWAAEELADQVIQCVLHMAEELQNEIEDLQARGRAAKAREMDIDAAVWERVGEILACGLAVRAIPETSEALCRLGAAITREVMGTTGDDTAGWRVRSASAAVLASLGRAASGITVNGGRVPKRRPKKAFAGGGPLEALVVRLFDLAVVWPDQVSEPSGAMRWRSGSGTLSKIPEALCAASAMKQTLHDWSVENFEKARALLEAMISNRVTEEEPLGFDIGAAMAAALGGSSPRDRTLINLHRALVEWCVAAPASRDELIQLQLAVAAIQDRDLRFKLMAPLALGWLKLSDVERARQAAQLADMKDLASVDFANLLLRVALGNTPFARERSETIPLLLDLIPRAIALADETLLRLLMAWFALGTEGDQTTCETTLRALVDWAVAARRKGHWD